MSDFWPCWNSTYREKANYTLKTKKSQDSICTVSALFFLIFPSNIIL